VAESTTSPIEQDALARLEDAWKDVVSINPELSNLLVRKFMNRLQQQPQLQSLVLPDADPNSVQKPSFSGSTLLNSTPTPTPKQENEFNQQKRRESAVKRKEESIPPDDSFEEDEMALPKTQGSQLADVLYGRWLEGLKSRWEGRIVR
jgi:hypothetical protein